MSAAWRAQRADRLEAGLMGHYLPERPALDERERHAAFGLGLIRDGNGPRALETLAGPCARPAERLIPPSGDPAPAAALDPCAHRVPRHISPRF